MRLSSDSRKAARSRRRIGDTSSSVIQRLEAGRWRDEGLVRYVVAIERLSDALERHVDILHEGRRESETTENEPKRQPQEIRQVSHFRYSWIHLLVICYGAVCFLSWVVYGPSRGGVLRHDLSQAVSPRFAQGIRATEVLVPDWRKPRLCLRPEKMGRECRTGSEWSIVVCSILAGVSGRFDDIYEGSVRTFVHVSPD